MMPEVTTTAKGREAEEQVAEYLRRRGYRILAMNVHVGRFEIDLVALQAKLVVFCEVRSLRNSTWIHPAETLRRDKLMRIRQAARRWLSTQPLGHCEIRFDVAAVTANGSVPHIEYYEDAF